MRVHRFQYLIPALALLNGCQTTPAQKEEIAPMGEMEIQRRFPTLTVDCIPEVRLDSWAWLDDYNLIVWTHAQRRNPYWLQMSIRCIGMSLRDDLRFLDRDQDRQICGGATDSVASTSLDFERRCPIGTVRPLDDIELNQVLIYFGKDPLPIRIDEEEEPKESETSESAEDTTEDVEDESESESSE